MQQRTLIILKPDAYQRRLLGTILARIESKGLKIAAMKLMRISESTAKQHYEPHIGKHFFDDLITYITSGPVVVLVAEGEESISVMRAMVGATCGYKAQPGTIRGDFSISMRYNLIHASDSEESAKREIDIFFSGQELIGEPLLMDQWIQGGE